MGTFAARAGSTAAAALLAFLTLSCSRAPQDRAAGARESRAAVISDQVHNGGVPGFFWLPPMAPTTAYGEFRAGLSPEVIIDRLPRDPAVPPVARFTAAELKTDLESHYMVNWDTKASALDPSLMYRIRVVLGWFELGYADVDVVSSGSELRNVQSGEFIPLLDGRTLPIKFRIDLAAMKCPERPDGPCRALDPCHDAGVCNPLDGTCSNPEKPNDTPCDDGNACTRTDACQAGTCTGANPVVCAAEDQCHDVGVCDPASGTCSSPPNTGATCDDGNACTQTDACQAGTCVGANPVVCAAEDQCHDVGVCDPASGTCSNPPNTGAPCDDGNACTRNDTCQVGTCAGADPVVCAAADQCHDVGVCDPADGTCSNPPNTGATCNDGNACTQTDTCLAGTCIGANPVLCEALDQCHLAGACDPSRGTCSNPTKDDGASCDDRNACTQTDACEAGRCAGANPVVCAALDVCHDAGTCDPSSGACSNPTNTAPCDDGNACTQVDTCENGACAGSHPVVCAALDDCHDAGTCDPRTGTCSMSTAKSDGAACSDGDGCTRTDRCEKGVCTGTDPVVCAAPPGGCWEPGTCDPGTGTCSVAIQKAAGTVCTGDGNFCTRERCENGTCLVTAEPIDCADTDACTEDTCDPERAGPDGVTGCVHLPDPRLAGCGPETPPATVSIVGLSSSPGSTEWVPPVLHANERQSFVIKLSASDARPDYQVELVLFRDASEDGFPLGAQQLSVTAGENEYWVELAIPETLSAGDYLIAAHEYPRGDLFPDGQNQPLPPVSVLGPEKPVLDVLELEVAQAALLIDSASTVDPANPTVRLETPYSARLDVVSHTLGAAGVPVTAQVTWNGVDFPLRLWDVAAGQWTETLVLAPLEANAPTSFFLELAMTEADAQQIRPGPGVEPVEGPVVIRIAVNANGAVQEGTCVPIDDPAAPVQCRHSVQRPALVYPAPPPPDDRPLQATAAPMSAAPMSEAPLAATLALPESGNTQPLTYEKAWSKTIGNKWAGAGIEFLGYAKMSQAGYEAKVEGGVPMTVLQQPFDFARAKATADALVETKEAHVRVNVSVIGITVYDWDQKAEVNLETTFAKVEKEKSYSQLVWVYIVPVTFKLGASGTLGLVGNLSASYVPGSGALEDTASLTVSGGPYVNVDAFGSAELGTAIFGAGARVTLTLVDAVLKGEATGALVLTKTSYGWPLQIAGGLSERLYYATDFLSGRVGLIVTYPTLKFCKLFWRIWVPCGVKVQTKEAVLCSWPGFSYGQDLLNLKQALFVIDMPPCPRKACGVGQCGPFNDGCEVVDCGGCLSPLTCGGGGVAGACGCTPTVTCDGKCDVIDNGCGLADCGRCALPQTCGGGGTPNVCGCIPTATCDGKCGSLDDGCNVTLDCGGCDAGQFCGGGGPNVCGTCQPNQDCTGKCGQFADGCGGTTTCFGSCPAGTTCGGGGVPNVCGCTPTATCDGKCGTVDDGCGVALECGGCPAGETCGGQGVPNVCAVYQPFRHGYASLGAAFDFTFDDEFWIPQTDLDRPIPAPVHTSYTGDSNTWYGAQWLANMWKQQVAGGSWTPAQGMADVYLRDSVSDCKTFYLAFHVSAIRAPGTGLAYYNALNREAVAALAPYFHPGFFMNRNPWDDAVFTYNPGDVFLFRTADSDASGAPTRLGKLYVSAKSVDSNWWTNECWGGVGFDYVIFDHQAGYYW